MELDSLCSDEVLFNGVRRGKSLKAGVKAQENIAAYRYMFAVFLEPDRSFVPPSSGYRTLSAVLLEAS